MLGFEFYVIGAYLDCVGCEHHVSYDCHQDCCLKCESRSFRLFNEADGSYRIELCCIWDTVCGPRPGKICEHYTEAEWR